MCVASAGTCDKNSDWKERCLEGRRLHAGTRLEGPRGTNSILQAVEAFYRSGDSGDGSRGLLGVRLHWRRQTHRLEESMGLGVKRTPRWPVLPKLHPARSPLYLFMFKAWTVFWPWVTA